MAAGWIGHDAVSAIVGDQVADVLDASSSVSTSRSA
jgi:hypothetical protein